MRCRSKEDILPKDKKGEFHGYHEWYLGGRLWLRGNFKHGLHIGYEEHHMYNQTRFHII